MQHSKARWEVIFHDTHHGSTELAGMLLQVLAEDALRPGWTPERVLSRLQEVRKVRSSMAVLVHIVNRLERELRTFPNFAPHPFISYIKALECELHDSVKAVLHQALNLVSQDTSPLIFYSRGRFLMELAARLIRIHPEITIWLAQGRHHDEGFPMAKELQGLGCRVCLWTDPALFSRLSQAAALWTGADFVTLSGIGNKIGTRPLVDIAKLYGIPRYCMFTSHKIIPMQDTAPFFRAVEHTQCVEKHHGVELFSSDLDLTELNGWSSMITEHGIFGPSELICRYKEHFEGEKTIN